MPDATPENCIPFKRSLPPATFLILFAAAAGAGVVSSYFLAFLLSTVRSAPWPVRSVHEHDGHFRLLDLLAGRLNGEEFSHGVHFYALQHVEEYLEALALIFAERVLLAVTPETYAFPQMVEREQMLLPVHVERAHRNVLLNAAERLYPEFLLLGVVRGEHLCFHRFEQARLCHRFDILVIKVEVEKEGLEDPVLERGHVPLLRIDLFRSVLVNELLAEPFNHLNDAFLHVAVAQHLLAHAVDRFALLVHHVVILEEIFSYLEVVPFDPCLGVLNGLCDQLVLYGHIFVHAELAEERRYPFRAENPHDLIFQRNVETGRPRVSLPPGPASKLIVDAPRFVPLRAEYVQTTQLDNCFLFFFADLAGFLLGLGALFSAFFLPFGESQRKKGRVASEEDVSAPACHVGRDGHGLQPARLSNNLSLAFMLLRVQYMVRDPFAFEHLSQTFRLVYGQGTDKNRTAHRVQLLDLLGSRFEFFLFRPVDHVRMIRADERPVGRNDNHVKVVDLLELQRFSISSTGHARELLVHPEKVLERDRGERLVLPLYLHVLLGFQCLVEAVAEASSRHKPAGKFIDDDYLPILHDVINVSCEELMSLQGLVDMVEKVDILRSEEHT